MAGITVVGAIGWLLVACGVIRAPLRLWAIWVIIVVGAVGATDILTHTAQLKFIRFTLAAAAPMYVLIAAAAPRLAIGRMRVGWLIPLGAAAMAIVALPRAYAPPWKIDFRTPALAIADRLQPHDAIVFIGPPKEDVGLALTYNGIRHYLPANEPSTVALLQNRATADQLAQLSACPQIWVVWIVPQSRSLDSILPGFVSLEPPGHVPYFIDLYRGRIESADHYSSGGSRTTIR